MRPALFDMPPPCWFSGTGWRHNDFGLHSVKCHYTTVSVCLLLFGLHWGFYDVTVLIVLWFFLCLSAFEWGFSSDKSLQFFWQDFLEVVCPPLLSKAERRRGPRWTSRPHAAGGPEFSISWFTAWCLNYYSRLDLSVVILTYCILAKLLEVVSWELGISLIGKQTNM